MSETSSILPATPAIPDYAELFCLSNFTFLEGASHAEELAVRAIQLGYAALAVTDECSLAGVVRAYTQTKDREIKLIIGAHFRIDWSPEQPPMTLIALAQNREGYGNLSELITLGRTRADKGDYRLGIDDFSAPQASHAHLRGLPDCLLILAPHYPADAEILEQQTRWLKQTFPQRAWLGLTQLYRPLDARHRGVLQATADRHGLCIAALGQVNMHVRSRKPLQDTLTAIRLGKAVGDCGYDLAPNAEQHLRSRLRLANIFPAAALQETLHIAALCTFKLSDLRYEYPEELVPDGQTPAAYLRQEVYLGAYLRYPGGIPQKVIDQIEHELTMINDMAYEPYFLTVYDIVRFARDQGILRQGRGSAANSVVCYCLGVTEVDPTCSVMLFERFISKERGEPPDIDVDFEHQRREEVIQYIYRKYGRMRAAIAAAVHTYRPRGVLRDVGKALGVDASIVDKVAKSHQWFDNRYNMLERFAECGLDPASPIAHQWAILAQQLLNFPRHLSQHSGGFVIARDKLSRLVPIENAAMPDRSVIQWDKDDLESLGLLKVDVLALGMLSALRRALELVGKRRGVPFTMQDIPREDPVTYDMICKADTIGVFQIESRAQMSMLPRLKPRRFYDLVVQVAIVRPGPIQGGMVHPFLRRREGREPETYPKEILRQALERTLGIPIFQEQVMDVAIEAAGYSPSEADDLRRSMAAWKRKGGMGPHYERLVLGMTDNGYSREFAESIFKQIEGFGEYGFPESHAASFALLAYASSWIKCHEPEAFLCSLLNSQPMGFYSPSQLIQDARRHSVRVLPADVMHSNWESTLEDLRAARPAVRLGLSLLGGMKEEAALRIEQARRTQVFSDIQELARRAGLDKRDLQALAAGNALVALSGHRREALWQALDAVPAKDLLRAAPLREESLTLQAPSEAEDIVADYRSAGLTLKRHPVALLRPILTRRKFLPHDLMATFQDGQFARGCGIVTVRQRPGTAKGVLFITIEDETGSTNVIIWPTLVEKQRNEVLNASLLGVYGIWQSHSGVKHLVAKRLVDLSYLLGEINVSSRDFC
ncbi:error-prone DNA polymerase [Herbaspirillum lusitanum]|uniref:error-prone DNA polymerase n=1 Tax=Herbaspirillum lusitanum TaxID=213312 RepID=UPI000494871C|nr:error-prone DNA polymerase [Herbaspirillum lusitanum]